MSTELNSDGFTPDEEKYFQHLYASKRRLKRRVLKRERCFAESLRRYVSENSKNHISNLESDLEWLLTWKLKTGCCPEIMWCDGTELDNILIENHRTLVMRGSVWIGPEKRDELDKVSIKGTVKLRPSMKNLKSYHFEIDYKGLKILARRT